MRGTDSVSEHVQIPSALQHTSQIVWKAAAELKDTENSL